MLSPVCFLAVSIRELLGGIRAVGCFFRDQGEGRSGPGWAGTGAESGGGDHSPGLQLFRLSRPQGAIGCPGPARQPYREAGAETVGERCLRSLQLRKGSLPWSPASRPATTETCKPLGSSKYTPALCLGSFSSRKQLNLSLWGSEEKKRQKSSPRSGIDVVGKTKCYRGDFPSDPVVQDLPSNAGGAVRSLVGELRAHAPGATEPERRS